MDFDLVWVEAIIPLTLLLVGAQRNEGGDETTRQASAILWQLGGARSDDDRAMRTRRPIFVSHGARQALAQSEALPIERHQKKRVTPEAAGCRSCRWRTHWHGSLETP